MALVVAAATEGASGGVSIWWLLIAVALAGGVGGLVNALISEKGVVLPTTVTTGGTSVWQPGWVGTVIAGIVAGAASWALYGPAAEAVLLSTKPSTAENDFALSLSTLAGALLVGFGGARWLSSESDKKLAQANTAEALKKNPNPGAAQQVSGATPRESVQILNTLA